MACVFLFRLRIIDPFFPRPFLYQRREGGNGADSPNSNPSLSSGESRANLTSSWRRSRRACVSKGGREQLIIQTDLASVPQRMRSPRRRGTRFGRIDILVDNAGVGPGSRGNRNRFGAGIREEQRWHSSRQPRLRQTLGRCQDDTRNGARGARQCSRRGISGFVVKLESERATPG